MSKTPPGVKRVVSVLNFFAEHPGQAFTFTDIVKALKLGRATCHALLAGLVEEQYLYRNADKSYVIGPALVAVGKIANEQFSPLQAAQPEMRMLSDECRAVCSAVYHENGNAVIKARAGSGSHLAWSVPQGYELPLRAAFAGVYFANASDKEIADWLEHLDPPVSRAEQDEFFEGLEFTRKHGYMFGVRNEDVETSLDAPELAFTGVKERYPISVVSELDPAREYPLSSIVAPVFDSHDRVAFVLNLSGFAHTVPGRRIEEMGQRLREAAERVTYFITGKRRPYPLPSA